MDQLHPDDYDDDMKAIVKYGEDHDIVLAAIQTLLDKYPAIMQATLLLEHKEKPDPDRDPTDDTCESAVMIAGDALGTDGAPDRVRAMRSCARFIEECTLHLMLDRGDDFSRDEDDEDDVGE